MWMDQKSVTDIEFSYYTMLKAFINGTGQYFAGI